MPKKILQIVESAYRATLEEQDDTVVWLTLAMKAAGGEFGVLLRGNAVNYAVKAQEASGLAFGERRQSHPVRLADDIAKLQGKGVEVHVVEEDLAERGIDRAELLPNLRFSPRSGIPRLLGGYDQVWAW